MNHPSKATEVRPVRIGSGRECLPKPMTKAQALRYAKRNMPRDLAKAGFVASVFTSDPEIHGASFFRINYSMHVGGRA